MRVIVCGSAPRRDRPGWTDRELLFRTLDTVAVAFHATPGRLTVVEGEAKGADLMAREWAEEHGYVVEPHPADWSRSPRGAGMIRNREMLDAAPPDDPVLLVVAFSLHWPVVGGTGGMCKLADDAGVPVRVVTPDAAVRHYNEQLVLR